jgi:hypothetical protein
LAHNAVEFRFRRVIGDEVLKERFGFLEIAFFAQGNYFSVVGFLSENFVGVDFNDYPIIVERNFWFERPVGVIIL